MTDQQHRTTSYAYAYDAVGHLISVTDPGGKVTQFTSFDPMGRVLSCIDA
jgi:YD repeat-containing protein